MIVVAVLIVSLLIYKAIQHNKMRDQIDAAKFEILQLEYRIMMLEAKR